MLYSLFSLKRGWNLWKKRLQGNIQPFWLKNVGQYRIDYISSKLFLVGPMQEISTTRQAFLTYLESQSELKICFILPICRFSHTIMAFIMSDLKGCFGNPGPYLGFFVCGGKLGFREISDQYSYKKQPSKIRHYVRKKTFSFPGGGNCPLRPPAMYGPETLSLIKCL